MTALTSMTSLQRCVIAPRRTLISMALALALAQYGMALAGPGGAQVVAGQVTVTQPNAQQTVLTQGSASAIVNWQQFSIAHGESVDFRQPSSNSVILNRVTGSKPSEIYGRLSANGQVFLVNPAGVLFGSTAQVNVGALVASTLNISDADFLANRYLFTAGLLPGTLVNQGQLQAAEHGTIALLGAKVNNDGTISAQLGTVALVAGDKIALDFNGDGLTKIRVDKAALAAFVENRGMLVADGGQAIMSAYAAQALAQTVLNQQGVVRARSLVERNGRIVLDGGEQGDTLSSGTLDVSGMAPGLKGGTIEVLGQHVGLVGNALLDARGDAGGGTILIGGDEHGANTQVHNAEATFVGPSTNVRADASGSGDGGKVVFWSDNATRVFGAVSATGGPGGGNGGFIETSGKLLNVNGARISAAAPHGKGGQWLLDPENIQIGGPCFEGPCSNYNISDGPNFTTMSNVGDGYLLPSTLVAALAAGTAVIVTTGDHAAETAVTVPSLGDITVAENIQYLGGLDATLTLAARRNITVNSGVTIRSGSGSTNDLLYGRLNLTLLSNHDGPNGGTITMAPDSAILSNGGNVLFAGGPSTDSALGFASGVSLAIGAQITTTRPSGSDGSVTMRANDEVITVTNAITLSGASIHSGSGAVLIDGTTLGSYFDYYGSSGVWLGLATRKNLSAVPTTIETTSGNINIKGEIVESGPVSGGRVTGVALHDSSIQTNSGSIVIIGKGGASNDSFGGNALGIDLSNFQLHANKGSVSLSGIGGNSSGDPNAHNNGIGRFDGVLAQSSTIDSTGGTIDIRGRAGTAPLFSPTGISLIDTTVATSGVAGAITISGEAPGPSNGPSLGISISGASTIGRANTSGNITLRALNASTRSDGLNMMNLGGTLASKGVLTLVPGGVSADGVLTEAPTVPIAVFGSGAAFSLGKNVLTTVIQPGFAGVVIGSATHTGLIAVAAGADLFGRNDITLQNGGAGSAGITLAGGVVNAGKMLTLSSGGAVTQGGPIVAGSLLLNGTQPESSFQLTDPLNAVGHFSARFDTLKSVVSPNFGEVNFVNRGDLDIGPLTGTGFDTGSNLPVSIRADAAVVAGDLFVHAGHDLILHQNVSTLGSDITFVVDHVFNNAANASLSPGGGGHWKVFADTWSGETPGPLLGSGPYPNRFNCAYGAPCMAALPHNENLFVYRQQPQVDLALVVPNPSRIYGSPNLPFAFTASGLVKADAIGTAVTGAYASPASATSNVQSYPIGGQFVSPAGYLVVATPGTLRVEPATLSYVATPAVRQQGSADAPLTGNVTGFVAGDTLEHATSGTPGFTSPAGIDAQAGQYAINGAGLTASNYVFAQAASNATALTVVNDPGIPPSFRQFPPTDPTSGFMPSMIPSIFKDVTFETSAVYGKNFGVQRLCAGTGPLAHAAGAPDANDTLATEWTRVKNNPNLSNCIGLVQRYSCGNF